MCLAFTQEGNILWPDTHHGSWGLGGGALTTVLMGMITKPALYEWSFDVDTTFHVIPHTMFKITLLAIAILDKSYISALAPMVLIGMG